jgi:hypothetical protein
MSLVLHQILICNHPKMSLRGIRVQKSHHLLVPSYSKTQKKYYGKKIIFWRVILEVITIGQQLKHKESFTLYLIKAFRGGIWPLQVSQKKIDRKYVKREWWISQFEIREGIDKTNFLSIRKTCIFLIYQTTEYNSIYRLR